MRKDVLDGGFVELVESMGDDASIVQAARVSYGKGTKTKRSDEKLIAYLWRNKHGTPFEMVQFKFHVKCPIYIARQWFRHRIGSFNEVSMRYSKAEYDFNLTSDYRQQSTKNKQCSEESIDSNMCKGIHREEQEHVARSYELYQKMIDAGVSREQARRVLPMSLYTRFYWSVNLRSLANFIILRDHEHAQKEIRVYGNAVGKIAETVAPTAVKLIRGDK